MNTAIYRLIVVLSFVIALSEKQGVGESQASQPVQAADTSDREQVDPRVLKFVKKIAHAEGDDELLRKQKDRHNVAVALLELRLDEYRRNAGSFILVLEAARLVVDSRLDLATEREEQLAVLESALEIAQLIEQHFQRTYDAGVSGASDLIRARFARLSVEVQILKRKREP